MKPIILTLLALSALSACGEVDNDGRMPDAHVDGRPMPDAFVPPPDAHVSDNHASPNASCDAEIQLTEDEEGDALIALYVTFNCDPSTQVEDWVMMGINVDGVTHLSNDNVYECGETRTMGWFASCPTAAWGAATGNDPITQQDFWCETPIISCD